MSTTDKELHTWGAHNVPAFVGVFSSDTLPDEIPRSTQYQTLIVNYDPSNAPGSHWVAMCVPPSGSGYFFDSYGHAPDGDDPYVHQRTEFRQYLTKVCGLAPRYNREDFQYYDTSVCGEYSAVYCWLASRGYDDTSNRFYSDIMQLHGKSRDKAIVYTYLNPGTLNSYVSGSAASRSRFTSDTDEQLQKRMYI
jgi:hypothetical protein